MINKRLLGERQVGAGLWEAPKGLLRSLEFTLQSSVFHSYVLQRKTGAMKSLTRSKTDRLLCIWEERAGLHNSSPPHRSGYMLATLFKAVVVCKATVPPHATEVSVPSLRQQLTTLPVVESSPHSSTLGAKPGHSSPSLENSTAEAERDERICAWRRPNMPSTHTQFVARPKD